MTATIFFEKLTDNEREEFVEGFNSADDIGVTDWDTATPWGCPWFWASCMESDSLDPEDWGKEWFKQNRTDILDCLADTE